MKKNIVIVVLSVLLTFSCGIHIFNWYKDMHPYGKGTYEGISNKNFTYTGEDEYNSDNIDIHLDKDQALQMAHMIMLKEYGSQINSYNYLIYNVTAENAYVIQWQPTPLGQYCDGGFSIMIDKKTGKVRDMWGS